jgi:ribonuclease BN (tRNA processing enzyme)
MGYHITSQQGRSFFYSGDTGNELNDVWTAISPQVLIIEVTSSDKWIEYSKQHGHLTPALLKTELAAFHHSKGYLPRVITVHMNPVDESNIRAELTEIASELGASIEVACEGMTIDL